MGAKFGEPMPKANLRLTYIFRDHRRRDMDNFVALGKYIVDGLVSAGVVEDDEVTHLNILPPKLLVDKERAPMTEVTVWEGR